MCTEIKKKGFYPFGMWFEGCLGGFSRLQKVMQRVKMFPAPVIHIHLWGTAGRAGCAARKRVWPSSGQPKSRRETLEMNYFTFPSAAIIYFYFSSVFPSVGWLPSLQQVSAQSLNPTENPVTYHTHYLQKNSLQILAQCEKTGGLITKKHILPHNSQYCNEISQNLILVL